MVMLLVMVGSVELNRMVPFTLKVIVSPVSALAAVIASRKLHGLPQPLSVESATVLTVQMVAACAVWSEVGMVNTEIKQSRLRKVMSANWLSRR